MKNKLILTISLCAAICACACAGTAAYADETATGTLYPEAFEASEIADYAVSGGNTYAFASEKKISVFRTDGKPTYYKFSENVTALDCTDGAFYYKLSSGTVYALPDTPEDTPQVSQHKMSVTSLPISEKGYSYSLNDGNINIWDGVNTPSTVEGSFSNLKMFEGVVYAVNENRLNKIVPPASAEVVPFAVADFSAVDNVAVGETLSLLKTYNLEKPHFATLKEGEYLTEIDLDKLTATSEVFKEAVGNTVRVGETENFYAGKTVLVLCKTGNADIISVNGACYIKLADQNAETRGLASPQFENATVCVPFDYAYSSPFVTEKTRLFKINWGDNVTVLGKFSAPELSQEFYKVSRETDGGEEIGYVPCGFLMQAAEGDTEHETKDPNYNDGDIIRTVVLVILVVVLILCAGGYLTYLLTVGRKKAAKTDDTENQ